MSRITAVVLFSWIVTLSAFAAEPCVSEAPDALEALSLLVGDKGDAPEPGTDWKEVFIKQDGTVTTRAGERAEFARAGRIVAEMQQRLARLNGNRAARAFHAEDLWMGEIEFSVFPASDIPAFARQGLFAHGGQTFKGRGRFSNSGSAPTPDKDFQARGFAFEVDYDGKTQTFLANTPKTLPGATGWDFMALAQAATDAALGKGPIELAPALLKYNRETFPARPVSLNIARATAKKKLMLARLAKAAAQQKLHPHRSLASLSYWSAAPIKVGPYAARYRYAPHSDNAPPIEPGDKEISDDYLGEEMRAQLERGDVKYTLVLEFFIDEDTTPLEDSTKDWDDGIQVPVGTITIKRGTPHDESLDAHRFSPWNYADGFRPLSNMMRIRQPVYEASADGRGAAR